jgi:hypothetical protein
LDIGEWIVGTWALYISMHGLASQHLLLQAYGAFDCGQCALGVDDDSCESYYMPLAWIDLLNK